MGEVGDAGGVGQVSEVTDSSLGIACASGSFKGAFVHGVLSAFEDEGVRAGAYAAASSTVIPAALAAIGELKTISPRYWQKGLDILREPGNGMSQVVLASITARGPLIRERLFRPGMPRMLVATSAVVNEEAAAEAQGNRATRLGRVLLLAAARGDRSWVDTNLRMELFDSQAEGRLRLEPGNFGEVTYASTRMLHAWSIPAWIDGRPYVDASYTCSCPALELAEKGYAEVVALSTEPGPLVHDLFSREPLPDEWKGVPIRVVRPDVDLKEMGVDFTKATAEGLAQVFAHGQEKGRAFLEDWRGMPRD